jgi:hypothetical protein
VVGTQRQVLTGADGSYAIDGVPGGDVSVVVRTRGYDSLATIAATRPVRTIAGQAVRLDLRASNTRDLRREFCPAVGSAVTTRRRYGRGVVRLLLVDSTTSDPLRGVPVIVTWMGVDDGSNAAGRERFQQDVADSRNVVTFCDLPTDIDVRISLPGSDGTRTHVATTQLRNNGVFGRVVPGRFRR